MTGSPVTLETTPIGAKLAVWAEVAKRPKLRELGPGVSKPPRYLLKARFFRAGLGRFASVDPAASSVSQDSPQSWNRYSYVENAPVNRFDPTGRHGVDGATIKSDFIAGCRQSGACQYGDLGASGSPGEAAFRNLMGGAILSLLAAPAAAYGTTAVIARGGPGLLLSGSFLLPAIQRGNQIEQILAERFGGGLPRSFPVIDRFLNGVATSVKTLDLGAKSYQNIARLSSTLQGFVDKLAGFEGAQVGEARVAAAAQVSQRVLELVVRTPTPAQLDTITQVSAYAQQRGVVISTIIVK